jgi:hypothetical protein
MLDKVRSVLQGFWDYSWSDLSTGNEAKIEKAMELVMEVRDDLEDKNE